MKFVDSTEIHVRAGDGGPGMVSFKSARNMPRLGADGGDGGHGGNVVLIGNGQINTLSSLRYKRAYHAENGSRGGANNRTGATGNDLRIDVPLGTIVHDMDTGVGLGEIVRHGDEIVVAKGGKRGLGNQRFLSSTHQAPEEYTPGGKGETRRIGLELKLLADVGFAGLPNAGKSTLLSRISAARPKIADYPFTTLVPHLGVVELSDSNEFGSESFVAADVPGLIEGASDGKGLGHAFLRHLERTRVIAYVVDAFSPDETATPVSTFKLLRAEMERYSPELATKRALVILNKIDLLQEETQKTHLETQMGALADLGCETIQISAVTGTGLRELKRRIYTMIKEGGDAAPSEAPAVKTADSEAMLPFTFVPTTILSNSAGKNGAADSSHLRRDV